VETEERIPVKSEKGSPKPDEERPYGGEKLFGEQQRVTIAGNLMRESRGRFPGGGEKKRGALRKVHTGERKKSRNKT